MSERYGRWCLRGLLSLRCRQIITLKNSATDARPCRTWWSVTCLRCLVTILAYTWAPSLSPRHLAAAAAAAMAAVNYQNVVKHHQQRRRTLTAIGISRHSNSINAIIFLVYCLGECYWNSVRPMTYVKVRYGAIRKFNMRLQKFDN